MPCQQSNECFSQRMQPTGRQAAKRQYTKAQNGTQVRHRMAIGRQQYLDALGNKTGEEGHGQRRAFVGVVPEYPFNCNDGLSHCDTTSHRIGGHKITALLGGKRQIAQQAAASTR